ncbi:putative F420-dependent oxidoreductase, MSMEG_4141 family [Mycobacterium parascrofulaceum ATCC BAA-614]|uniref:Putative F420-dependent oxidoreductase, MSMEG_4141 family n=1 Tax=Mycobacterium parascrofulaceum ATCC BAA-614 TaxID=525368 RepID=D5P613_9MYCO|nr:TIGR03620 family F420-dependent LLM class oxidoreductase [Mycobacterium parascrofulaceum]EFG78499.1 putative F420-dependent oxidoreductase, MSMEG_4141 family [Mycobacterium parascrofulaceum ATCC BAA-614]
MAPPKLGPFGAFTFGPVSAHDATELEQLGYGTLWIGGSPEADLTFAEPLLAATKTLVLATSVVNIWSAPAQQVAAAFHRIDTAYPGRFLLGIGAGHREHTVEYRQPLAALAEYLDELDAAGIPTDQRILAALGPKMLQLAAERSAGANPALTPTRYNYAARTELGHGPLLVPVQAILLNATQQTARVVGSQIADVYLGLRNYVNNWRRLGYTDDDLTPPGSQRLIDDLLAYGDPGHVATRLREHLDTGADHVAIQVPGTLAQLLAALRELAEPLGLSAH